MQPVARHVGHHALSHRTYAVLGTPDNPMPDEEVIAKRTI